MKTDMPLTITGRPVTKASGVRLPLADYLLARKVSRNRGISFNQLLVQSLKKELSSEQK
ncbi:MAG: hypothetical protein H6633_35790 [Anaerolineales bacterium]|nr:hypothetical protein [Anaerolineales bacterium]